MASRRQCLSQRRKAVGMTQESLAERLGVERSTIVRWEAGDTEPLPSIRPNLASALQVSIDQLAELLTQAEDAGTTHAPAAETDLTVPMLLPGVASQMQPEQAQFETLTRPQATESVESLRRALRSADVSPQYFAALLLVCGISRAPLVTQLLAAELSGLVAVHTDPQAAIALDTTLPGLATENIRPADHDTSGADVRLDTLVPATVGVAGLDGSDVPDPARTEVAGRPSVATPWRRATSRRFTRFAAAGVLVLAGAAASVSFVNFSRTSLPPTAAGITTPPVAAIPAPNPGSSNDNSPPAEATQTPPAAPSTAIGGTAPPQAVAAPAARTTKAGSHNRATSRSKPPAAKTPPRRPPAIPADAYAAWSHMAQLSGSDQSGARLRSQSPSRP